MDADLLLPATRGGFALEDLQGLATIDVVRRELASDA